MLATHGFNVSRQDGIDALSNWSRLMSLSGSDLFVGVLWPGDSRYLPVLDYPAEGDEAIASGRLLARFLNEYAASAASLSLVSHSLGGRVILEATSGLDRTVRRLILMAGAIEDDCLTREYQAAAGNAQQISVLASRKDDVLAFLIDFDNLELVRVTDESGEILGRDDVDLGGGQEGFHSDIHEQAALHNGFDFA